MKAKKQEKQRRVKNNKPTKAPQSIFSSRVMICIGLILILIPIIIAAGWTVDLQTNLLVYLTLNESSGTNAFNIINTTANFTVSNSGSWVDGKIGKGLNFTGTTYYLSNSNLFIKNWVNFTVSVWVAPITSGGKATILDFIGGDAGDAGNDSTIKIRTNDIQFGEGITFNYKFGTNATWTHLVLVREGKNRSIYINGTLLGSKLNGVSRLGYIRIGAESTPSEYFIGTIDEFAMWSEPLSPAKITQLYNSGAGITFGVETGSSSITENSQTFNSTTAEIATESYNINVTHDSTEITNINGTLFYNGTETLGTKTGTEDNITFIATKDIADIAGDYQNHTFYWELGFTNSSGSFKLNSTFQSQIVNQTIFALCNSTLTTRYLNLSFKEETNNTVLNASIPTSTFRYWLTNPVLNRSLTFSDNVLNSSFEFCFSPPDRSINLLYLLQYTSTNYPQRSILPKVASFSNATTDRTLYLLLDTDGLYVTWQVVNSAEQPLGTVFVNATRVINGLTVLIGEGFTSSNGGITFWVNPNFLHLFSFFKTGFPFRTDSQFPTQASQTMVLGSSTVVNETDTVKGVSFSIEPNQDTLINNTQYSFNFTISSSFWLIDSFGFTLENSTKGIVASISSSSDSGTVNLAHNTGNDTTMIMNYFWLSNGTYTNGTRSWLVINDAGTGWSIKTFFTDLSTYVSGGMFGLDNFGLALITFFIIFIFTGMMSFRFGLISPAAISTLVFTLVLFFDVGLDLMDNLNPISRIPHFPLMFIGIITVGIFIREVIR